jgi:hypothetical protein
MDDTRGSGASGARGTRRWLAWSGIALVALAVLLGPAGGIALAANGAIFTTTAAPACTAQNGNVIYPTKPDVWLAGQQLDPGNYGFVITNPGGSLTLGTTTGDPIVVDASGGFVGGCVQLWSLSSKNSDHTTGYDDTDSSGGEYKVTLTQSGQDIKSDNFKVGVAVTTTTTRS